MLEIVGVPACGTRLLEPVGLLETERALASQGDIGTRNVPNSQACGSMNEITRFEKIGSSLSSRSIVSFSITRTVVGVVAVAVPIRTD